MAIFEFKLELKGNDNNNLRMNVKVKSRSNVDPRTISLKALKEVVEVYFSTPLDTMESIISLRRASEDWEGFAKSVEQELKVKMTKPTVVEK